MEYVSVIVDELNEIVEICSGLSERKIEEILENNPEFKRTCVLMEI